MVRSTVDTAICTKPRGDLAGQLLYGDSLQCSNWAMGLARGLGRSGLTAPRCAMLCSTQFVLPNRNIISNYPRSGFSTYRHLASDPGTFPSLESGVKIEIDSIAMSASTLECSWWCLRQPTGSRERSLTMTIIRLDFPPRVSCKLLRWIRTPERFKKSDWCTVRKRRSSIVL